MPNADALAPPAGEGKLVAGSPSTGLLIMSLLTFTLIYMLFGWSMVGALRGNISPERRRHVRNQAIFLICMGAIPLIYVAVDRFKRNPQSLGDAVIVGCLSCFMLVGMGLAIGIAVTARKETANASKLSLALACIASAVIGLASLALLASAYDRAVTAARTSAVNK